MHSLMKSFLSVVLLLFGQQLFAQENSFSSMKTKGLNVYELSKAFSNWFVASDINQAEDFKQACNKIGLAEEKLHTINAKLNGTQWFEQFQGEMFYFHELDSVYWKKVGEIIFEFVPSIEKRIEESMSSNGMGTITLYTPDIREVEVVFYHDGRGNLKKLNWSVQGNVTTTGDFTDSKGKPKKISSGLKSYKALIHRNDSSAVAIEFFSRKKSLPVAVSISEITQHAPFIRKYFLSEKKIVEGTQTAITWDVYGTDQVLLEEPIGYRPAKGQLIVAPESTRDYSITAVNEMGQSSMSLQVEVERIFVNRAEVTFFCKDKSDSKKQDQEILIRVRDTAGNIRAEKAVGKGLEFKGEGLQGNYYGPFVLETFVPMFKKELLHGSFEFTMTGKSKDQWDFTPLLWVHYSDGTKGTFFGFGDQFLETDATPLVFKF